MSQKQFKVLAEVSNMPTQKGIFVELPDCDRFADYPGCTDPQDYKYLYVSSRFDSMIKETYIFGVPDSEAPKLNPESLREIFEKRSTKPLLIHWNELPGSMNIDSPEDPRQALFRLGFKEVKLRYRKQFQYITPEESFLSVDPGSESNELTEFVKTIEITTRSGIVINAVQKNNGHFAFFIDEELVWKESD